MEIIVKDVFIGKYVIVRSKPPFKFSGSGSGSGSGDG